MIGHDHHHRCRCGAAIGCSILGAHDKTKPGLCLDCEREDHQAARAADQATITQLREQVRELIEDGRDEVDRECAAARSDAKDAMEEIARLRKEMSLLRGSFNDDLASAIGDANAAIAVKDAAQRIAKRSMESASKALALVRAWKQEIDGAVDRWNNGLREQRDILDRLHKLAADDSEIVEGALALLAEIEKERDKARENLAAAMLRETALENERDAALEKFQAAADAHMVNTGVPYDFATPSPGPAEEEGEPHRDYEIGSDMGGRGCYLLCPRCEERCGCESMEASCVCDCGVTRPKGGPI